MKKNRHKNKTRYCFALVISTVFACNIILICCILTFSGEGWDISRDVKNTAGFCAAVFTAVLYTITVWALRSLKREKEYVEELLALKSEMQNQVELDPLTMLYNKKITEELIHQRMCSMKKEQKGVFMIIDVDGFKRVNDTYGHPLGDKVLVKLALRLKQAFRDTDIVGRIGGDEFCVFYSGNFGDEEIRDKAITVSAMLCNLHVSQHEDIRISCSCGISTVTGGEKSFEQIYREADRALYTVKKTGKNGYAFYPPMNNRDGDATP